MFKVVSNENWNSITIYGLKLLPSITIDSIELYDFTGLFLIKSGKVSLKIFYHSHFFFELTDSTRYLYELSQSYSQ